MSWDSHFSPSKLPLYMLWSGPQSGPNGTLPWWNDPSPHPKQHLDWFSCFCTAHSRESLYSIMGRPFLHQKLPLHLGDLDAIYYGSLDPPGSTHQMSSRSVQPFLQGSPSWQTDHATYCNNRMHLRSTAKWPKMNYIQHQKAVSMFHRPADSRAKSTFPVLSAS